MREGEERKTRLSVIAVMPLTRSKNQGIDAGIDTSRRPESRLGIYHHYRQHTFNTCTGILTCSLASTCSSQSPATQTQATTKIVNCANGIAV